MLEVTIEAVKRVVNGKRGRLTETRRAGSSSESKPTSPGSRGYSHEVRETECCGRRQRFLDFSNSRVSDSACEHPTLLTASEPWIACPPDVCPVSIVTGVASVLPGLTLVGPFADVRSITTESEPNDQPLCPARMNHGRFVLPAVHSIVARFVAQRAIGRSLNGFVVRRAH